MSKHVFRLCPYSHWEIDAIEAWLDDMARRGLLLENLDFDFCLFQRVAPCEARFRIDVRTETGREVERRMEEIGEFGWEYMGNLARKMDVYRSMRLDAAEFNTDEELFQRAIHKSQFGSFIATALLIPWLIYFNWDTLLQVKEAMPYLFEDFFGVLPWLLALLFLAVLVTSKLYQLVPYLLLKKRRLLDRDYHTPQRARYRGLLKWAMIILGVALFLSLVLLVVASNNGYFIR